MVEDIASLITEPLKANFPGTYRFSLDFRSDSNFFVSFVPMYKNIFDSELAGSILKI